jgi:hypothetical protein
MCLVMLGRGRTDGTFLQYSGANSSQLPSSFNAPNVRSAPNSYHSLQNTLLPRQSHATLPHVLLASLLRATRGHLLDESLLSSPSVPFQSVSS